jgi:hypothetical protein
LTIQTRRTKWGQFLTLLSSIACAVVAGLSWFLMGDDEGKDTHTWQVKVAGVVTTLVVAVILIWLAYQWRLGWHVGGL